MNKLSKILAATILASGIAEAKTPETTEEIKIAQAVAKERSQTIARIMEDRVLAKKADGAIDKIVNHIEPLCAIGEISKTKDAPRPITRGESSDPLQCVVGLHNAVYFTMESLSGAACVDTIASEVAYSPALSEEMKELCEWGYIKDPRDLSKYYWVATCDTDLSEKTSPNEGYQLRNWSQPQGGVLTPFANCQY